MHHCPRPLSSNMSRCFVLGLVPQNHARQHAVSMDGLRFEFEILGNSTIESGQDDPATARQAAAVTAAEAEGGGKAGGGTGAYVQGLFLECARWDGEQKCLADCAPKQVRPLSLSLACTTPALLRAHHCLPPARSADQAPPHFAPRAAAEYDAHASHTVPARRSFNKRGRRHRRCGHDLRLSSVSRVKPGREAAHDRTLN